MNEMPLQKCRRKIDKQTSEVFKRTQLDNLMK